MPLKFHCPKCKCVQVDEGQKACAYCKVAFSIATLYALAHYKGDTTEAIAVRQVEQ